MTHRLVLVRHARAASSAGQDLLRPLTDQGQRQAEEQGQRLRAWAPFGPVHSSPARRCLETAHGLVQGLDLHPSPEVEIIASLSEHAREDELVRHAREAPDSAILVSHQPGLALIMDAFLGNGSPVAFSPATAVLLERGPEGWSLVKVLPAP